MIYRCCNNEHIVVENGLLNESWTRNENTSPSSHLPAIIQTEKSVRTHAENPSISGVQHSISFFFYLVKCQNHHHQEREVLGTTANICLVCQLIWCSPASNVWFVCFLSPQHTFPHLPFGNPQGTGMDLLHADVVLFVWVERVIAVVICTVTVKKTVIFFTALCVQDAVAGEKVEHRCNSLMFRCRKKKCSDFRWISRLC